MSKSVFNLNQNDWWLINTLKWTFILFLDLEKVTDYAEEKEIVAASTAALDDAIATVRKCLINQFNNPHK